MNGNCSLIPWKTKVPFFLSSFCKSHYTHRCKLIPQNSCVEGVCLDINDLIMIFLKNHQDTKLQQGFERKKIVIA